jgi:hypothetical protein
MIQDSAVSVLTSSGLEDWNLILSKGNLFPIDTGFHPASCPLSTRVSFHKWYASGVNIDYMLLSLRKVIIRGVLLPS